MNLKKRSGTFKDFLLEKDQLTELITGLVVFIVLMIVFQQYYPYTVLTGDSGDYILRAKERSMGLFRPYGYSFFLYMLHSISDQISVIIYGQSILYFLSTSFLVFTVKFFFAGKKIVFRVFYFLMIFNLLALYSNVLLMSDSLFYSVSLIYIATLIWFYHTNKIWIFIVNLIILLFLLNIRYVALIYPILYVLFFVITGFNRRNIVLSIIPFILSFVFYKNVSSNMEKKSGINTFSGFSGWALANNALSVIPYIELEVNDIKDPEVKYIHSFVKQFPDSLYTHKFIKGTGFMWNNKYAGKRILYNNIKTYNMPYPQAWVKTGEMLSEYGKYLIFKYPWLYFNHFIIPNTINLFKNYTIHYPNTYKAVKLDFFKVPVQEHTYDDGLVNTINPIIKIVNVLIWILFLAVTILFIFKNSISSREKGIVKFIYAFLLSYGFMSVISHPINNFRYIIPVYPLVILLAYLIFNRLKK